MSAVDLADRERRTNYAVATDYDYTATHKRERLSIWSGPFASTWEAFALSLPSGRGYAVTTYNGERFHVAAPTPRTDANYHDVDAAIESAMREHYAARAVNPA